VELKWDATTTRFKNLARSRGGYAGDDAGFGGPFVPVADKGGSGPGTRGGGGYTGAQAFDAGAGTSGFAPGKKTGPVPDHRDGGGPDREGLLGADDDENDLPI
jgi:hypothetical protein